MGTVARKRLLRDLKKLQGDGPSGISAAPVADDIMRWHAVMFGPDDTPWEGGTFQLEVKFTEEFPTKPPHVLFYWAFSRLLETCFARESLIDSVILFGFCDFCDFLFRVLCSSRICSLVFAVDVHLQWV